MMKDLFVTLGLLCIFITNPFFLRTANCQSDSIVMNLPTIYRIADEENSIIRISETNLRAANETLKQSKNDLLPNVNISLNGSYIGDATLMSRSFSTKGTTDVIVPGLGVQTVNNGRQQSPHWGNVFSVEATQVIYSGGALKSSIEMAKLGEQIAELNVEKNRQDVRFLLTGYYLDLVKLQNQKEVIDKHIALTEEVLTQMRAREGVGVVLHNDLTRYELQLKQLQLTRVKLLDAQSVIQHKLKNAIHLPATTVILPDTADVSREYTSLEQTAHENEWRNQAIDNNIGIREAQIAEQISEQQTKAIRAGSIPTIVAFAKNELFGPYTTDLIPVNANVNAWFVGIGIKYDLGSLWNNRHSIKKTKADSELAHDRIDLLRENVNNEIHEAYVHFLTAFVEVETQQKQVELADENYSIVEKRYNHDLALLTDLLDASSMKLQADISLVNARIALLYDYYKLKYITNTL
jgi:outer membrane protein TolC